jgi:RNA polymerase sigma-70 factor (ECF subfamily)
MNDKTAIFLEYRALLFSIAYNMLGVVADAEDIVQDTFLKWMEIQSANVRQTKSYLVKIVTNKCINYLNSARARREEYFGLWLPEPLLNHNADKTSAKIESYHALSIGILVLLQKLSPMERAIFLLKEVFAYDYYELAETFEKTEDNCRQILKRAKDNLGKDASRFEVDMKVHERVLHNFLRAVSEGSMDELVTLLKEDIVLYADGGGKAFMVNGQRLTAFPKPIYGREKVCHLLLTTLPKLFQHVPDYRQEIIITNGLPAIISYTGKSPVALVSIEPYGDTIGNIYVQTNPDKLQPFNLPDDH